MVDFIPISRDGMFSRSQTPNELDFVLFSMALWAQLTLGYCISVGETKAKSNTSFCCGNALSFSDTSMIDPVKRIAFLFSIVGCLNQDHCGHG